MATWGTPRSAHPHLCLPLSVTSATFPDMATKKKTDDSDDVRKYARLFDTFDATYPISKRFEQEDQQKVDRWWASERQHMGCYFASRRLTGRPDGDRKPRQPNLSAAAAYGALRHAEGIMWIAEAVGVDDAVLWRLYEEIFYAPEAPARGGSRVRHLREKNNLPWSLIHDLSRDRLDSRTD